jgi:hypothetical protein
MPILHQQKERWMPIASNLLAKTANRRPSSFWAYLTKQITSSYMQVPEDLQVLIVNFTSAFASALYDSQVKFANEYKCNLSVLISALFV